MNHTVQPVSAMAPTTTDERRPTATTPTKCPAAPYCVVEHGVGERTTVHLSGEVLLRRPADHQGSNILARTELFRCDEEGEQGKTVLFMQGQDPFELGTLDEVDAFIGDAEAFVASLRAMREQMAQEIGARAVDYSAERTRLQAITADVTDERPFTRDAIAHMRDYIPDFKAQADEYEALHYGRELLDELVAEHGARVVEIDTSDLPDGTLTGRCDQIDGALVLTFPRGQAPAERLTRARELLAKHTA